MKADCLLTIDPGKTGAIAIKFNGKYVVHKMPADLMKIDELLKFYKGNSGSMLVILEQIRLHRTDDMAKASRMQKLFEQYAELKTLLTMNGIPFTEVSPRSWQSFLGLRTKQINAMKPHERKRAYRDFAQAWWPTKLSIQVADSVCLLIYGERNLKFNPDFGVQSKGVQKLI
jgi:hypothetical protein